MANLLEEYIAKLNGVNKPYTPLTEAEIEAKAKNRYQALYDQNRLSAQQTYDAEKLAREQALANQLDQYQLQREQSAENYRRAQADAVRSALSRGMQRSSYIGATVGNIGIKGNEAQQAILKNQEGTVRNAAAQEQLAASQLAAQLAQYDKGQLADQLAYQDELEAREYDRGQTAADRAAQIAGDIYDAQLYATQNNLFGYGVAPSYGGGSSSSGGFSRAGGSSGGGGKGGGGSNDSNTNFFDKLIAGLGGDFAGASKGGVNFSNIAKGGTPAVKTTSAGGSKPWQKQSK